MGPGSGEAEHHGAWPGCRRREPGELPEGAALQLDGQVGAASVGGAATRSSLFATIVNGASGGSASRAAASARGIGSRTSAIQST